VDKVLVGIKQPGIFATCPPRGSFYRFSVPVWSVQHCSNKLLAMMREATILLIEQCRETF
jgi:hypothetical protein